MGLISRVSSRTYRNYSNSARMPLRGRGLGRGRLGLNSSRPANTDKEVDVPEQKNDNEHAQKPDTNEQPTSTVGLSGSRLRGGLSGNLRGRGGLGRGGLTHRTSTDTNTADSTTNTESSNKTVTPEKENLEPQNTETTIPKPVSNLRGGLRGRGLGLRGRGSRGGLTRSTVASSSISEI